MQTCELPLGTPADQLPGVDQSPPAGFVQVSVQASCALDPDPLVETDAPPTAANAPASTTATAMSRTALIPIARPPVFRSIVPPVRRRRFDTRDVSLPGS